MLYDFIVYILLLSRENKMLIFNKNVIITSILQNQKKMKRKQLVGIYSIYSYILNLLLGIKTFYTPCSLVVLVVACSRLYILCMLYTYYANLSQIYRCYSLFRRVSRCIIIIFCRMMPSMYIQIFITTQKGKICLVLYICITYDWRYRELYYVFKTTRLYRDKYYCCTFVMFEQTFISSPAIVNIILKLFTGLAGAV